MKFSHQSTAWLLDSPLFSYIETYKQFFIQGSCSSETIEDYLYCFAHFAHWLTQSNLDIRYINEETIHTFINPRKLSCHLLQQPKALHLKVFLEH